MNLNELINDLGNHIGLADLALDANGVCGLAIGDDVHVNLERHPTDDHTLLLHSTLRLVPTENVMRRQLQMLVASHHTKRSHGCVFALDSSTGDAVLWTNVHATEKNDVESLAEALRRLIASVREWTAILNAAHHSPSTSDEFSPDLSAMIRV